MTIPHGYKEIREVFVPETVEYGIFVDTAHGDNTTSVMMDFIGALYEMAEDGTRSRNDTYTVPKIALSPEGAAAIVCGLSHAIADPQHSDDIRRRFCDAAMAQMAARGVDVRGVVADAVARNARKTGGVGTGGYL